MTSEPIEPRACGEEGELVTGCGHEVCQRTIAKVTYRSDELAQLVAEPNRAGPMLFTQLNGLIDDRSECVLVNPLPVCHRNAPFRFL